MPAEPIQGSTPPRPSSLRMPRVLSLAITTAALPAVLMSALALADPAHAAPVSSKTTLFQQVPLHAGINLATGTAKTAARAQVTAQIPVTVTAEPSGPATHRIEAGDTVTSIAGRYGLSVAEVLRVNNLHSDSLIFPGGELRLSAAAPSVSSPSAPAAVPSTPAAATYTVAAGDTLSGIAAAHGLGLDSVLAANALTLTSVIRPGQEISLSGAASSTPASAAPALTAPAPAASHTVKAGDTLTGIAARHNVGLAELMSANGMDGSSVLYPGDVIALAGSVTTLSSPPVEAAPVEAATADLVPSTFLHYTYPDQVVADANANKAFLNRSAVPGRAEMQQIVARTAEQMGVDPSLALAFSFQESGFDQRAVSPANAIGAMQVIPSSGDWASGLVGRELNLLDPYDNATAGVAIIRSLLSTADSLETAVASYYQGQYSVTTQGMYEDTVGYVASVLAHRQSFS